MSDFSETSAPRCPNHSQLLPKPQPAPGQPRRWHTGVRGSPDLLPQTCMWLCGLSWMPVTRSAWPHRSRRVSSVFTLCTLTKSPEAYSRYLRGGNAVTPAQEARAPRGSRRPPAGRAPPGAQEHPPIAAARAPVPLAWSRQRTRPWRRAGRRRRSAPRGANPATPSCPAATRAPAPPRPALIGPAAAACCGRAARAPPHGDTGAAQEGNGPETAPSITRSVAPSGQALPKHLQELPPPWTTPYKHFLRRNYF